MTRVPAWVQAMNLSAGSGWLKVVSLREVAAEGGEKIEVVLVFDAFGDNFEVEGVCEVDGGADDRGTAAVGADVRDEGPIDLEFIDRKVTQVGESAVARPVVVDCDPQPEVAESVEDLTGARGAS